MRKLGLFIVVLALFSSPSAFGYDLPAPERPSSRIEKRTVAGVLRAIGPRAEARLRPLFAKAGVAYPPPRVAFIAMKDELELEVRAWNGSGWTYITTYEVYGASGGLGPKQRAGDGQVPEGIYAITALNPNSSFHLSMRLDYPNRFDRSVAQADGRSDLGGDIYLHGKTKSKGCIAVGDRAIEELFVLAARTGIENVNVMIVPYDFRRTSLHSPLRVSPPWLPELYSRLGHELAKYGLREGS